MQKCIPYRLCVHCIAPTGLKEKFSERSLYKFCYILFGAMNSESFQRSIDKIKSDEKLRSVCIVYILMMKLFVEMIASACKLYGLTLNTEKVSSFHKHT